MTSDAPSLDAQADEFAGQMEELLLATVTDSVSIASSKANLDQTLYVVGNQMELGSHDEKNIRRLRGELIPVAGLEGVNIAANWFFVPNSTGEWLKSSTAGFGLYVGDTPFVRLEVDASKREGSWLQAHIHITAESRLLGYLRGLQGQDRTRLEKLHLPVGGFRFRPGLEDFLEFAIDEQLIPGKPGWQERIEPTRTEFRKKQFMAMVKDHPEWAREGLAHLD